MLNDDPVLQELVTEFLTVITYIETHLYLLRRNHPMMYVIAMMAINKKNKRTGCVAHEYVPLWSAVA